MENSSRKFVDFNQFSESILYKQNPQLNNINPQHFLKSVDSYKFLVKNYGCNVEQVTANVTNEVQLYDDNKTTKRWSHRKQRKRR